MNSLLNKINYLVDQKFEVDGVTFKVHYNDGNEEVTALDFEVRGFDVSY